MKRTLQARVLLARSPMVARQLSCGALGFYSSEVMPSVPDTNYPSFLGLGRIRLALCGLLYFGIGRRKRWGAVDD